MYVNVYADSSNFQHEGNKGVGGRLFTIYPFISF